MENVILFSAIALVLGIAAGLLISSFGLKSKAEAIIKEANLKGDAIRKED